MNINEYGFVKVAAASPKVRVADCNYNAEQIKLSIDQAIKHGVQLLVFPELSITSSTCRDLFLQDSLQLNSIRALESIVDFMKNKPSLITVVGMPLRIDSLLFNVACVISSNGIAGFIPQSSSDTNKWFSPANDLPTSVVVLSDYPIPIGNIIIKTPQMNIGFEVGGDSLLPNPPSINLAINGADIVCNLSAKSAQVDGIGDIRSSITNQSRRLLSGFIYASAGVGESTTDEVYPGYCMIAECGDILSENKGFSLDGDMVISEIDITSVRNQRLRNIGFNTRLSKVKEESDIIIVDCNLNDANIDSIKRYINPHPFIPTGISADNNFQNILDIQAHALVKRLLHTGVTNTTIGISGGLDSTLALLVMIKSYDLLKIPRTNIHGITMPGFGTTNHTYQNALDLMKSLGISSKEISIRESVTQHFKDIDHDINKHDLTYENSQARERTQILMDYSGKVGGFVVGTGNMSELALGWATYNGDHMSMYAVNAGVPKTLVQALVSWIAENEYNGLTKKILQDIVNTPYSPELLPADEEGQIAQKTEHFIGPYELHDYFLYRMINFGDSPLRILFLAKHAFKEKYSDEEIRKWLKIFIKRFFSQQFKRSCMPDAPRVVSVSLSPRNGLSMPSDAVYELWLKELDN